MRSFLSLLLTVCSFLAQAQDQRAGGSLASELHSLGWIACSAQTAAGDWDLYVMRPDGTDRQAITNTREYNEAGVRFSPDGTRILYYRMPASESVDNNTYGTYELVVADRDGHNVVSLGREFPWASWSPNGRELACLVPGGIRIVDLATHQIVRTLPRQGVVQQLIWSPDGSSFIGTANGLGPYWNIGCISGGGRIVAVSETERYNCTPDWCPDSRHVLYARGIIPQQAGRAELWIASRDGTEKSFLYGEEARHIYGACSSPDGKYLLFTRSVEDLGAVGKSQTTMAIIRRADTPMNGDGSLSIQKRFPGARPPQRQDLGPGWEPHWTFAPESPPAGN